MPKEATTKKDATGRGKDSNAAAKTDKKASDDSDHKDEASGSEAIELEAVKSKKGEPDDNLRRRAEWFQKRTGGG